MSSVFFRPLIIVGAPRSGTNMLRDVLTSLPLTATWPCDEINFIWRFGNARYPSDELPASLARPSTKAYIRRQFERLARSSGARWIVEKTCANCLRIEFVDRVVPDAVYIYIKRDPIDAVASAMSRWSAPFEPRYVARKARYVPLRDLPYYAWKHAANRIRKAVTRDGHLPSWGPRFDGIDALVGSRPLEEVCAIQWQRCVQRAEHSLNTITPSRVFRVEYETFVANPRESLRLIAEFLGVPFDEDTLTRAVADVRADSVGKGRAAMGLPASTRVLSILDERST